MFIIHFGAEDRRRAHDERAPHSVKQRAALERRVERLDLQRHRERIVDREDPFEKNQGSNRNQALKHQMPLSDDFHRGENNASSRPPRSDWWSNENSRSRRQLATPSDIANAELLCTLDIRRENSGR